MRCDEPRGLISGLSRRFHSIIHIDNRGWRRMWLDGGCVVVRLQGCGRDNGRTEITEVEIDHGIYL